MSPEQARGKAVDKRTDIWAFGCCFFEALTGITAFLGETLSDTIAAVLGKEPDWEQLPPSTPSSVHRLLQRCLRKDTERRLHDMADVRIDIEEASAEPPAAIVVRDTSSARKRQTLSWILAALAALATGVAVWKPKPQPPRPLGRFVINTPPEELFSDGHHNCVTSWSSDGLRLAYETVGPDTGSDLGVLSLDGEPKPTPFLVSRFEEFAAAFSPDGRFIAYVSNQSGQSEVYVRGPTRARAAKPLSPPGAGRNPSGHGTVPSSSTGMGRRCW